MSCSSSTLYFLWLKVSWLAIHDYFIYPTSATIVFVQQDEFTVVKITSLKLLHLHAHALLILCSTAVIVVKIIWNCCTFKHAYHGTKMACLHINAYVYSVACCNPRTAATVAGANVRQHWFEICAMPCRCAQPPAVCRSTANAHVVTQTKRHAKYTITAYLRVELYTGWDMSQQRGVV